MSAHGRDQELDAFLERRSPLYTRLAELDAPEPSPQLDALVLARARQALRPPAPSLVNRLARWAAPAAVAATVLLSFAMLLRIGPPSPVRERLSEEAASRAAAQDARSRETERAMLAKQASEAERAARPAGPPAAADTAATADAANAPLASARGLKSRPAKDPDAWLAEIERLRKSGQIEAAARQWQQFRQAYPGHPAARPAAEPARE